MLYVQYIPYLSNIKTLNLLQITPKLMIFQAFDIVSFIKREFLNELSNFQFDKTCTHVLDALIKLYILFCFQGPGFGRG